MLMRTLAALLAAAGLGLALPVAAAPPAQAPAPPLANGRILLPANVVPTHYELQIAPDAAHARFTGSERIDIEVRSSTAVVELNAANLEFGRVALEGRTGGARVTLDTARETAALRFAAPLAPGRYRLDIEYSGHINDQPAGLFALDYSGRQGGRQRALFTQFENSDARRFMPCWDEPARKATFSLAATVPAGQMAVSNMPIASSTPAGTGLVRVQFRTTPRMSSYLLFFALGDFERVAQKVNGVEVGVVVKRGDADQARYALDAAVHLLPYYEQYFGVRYPLPKLDLIAGPGTSEFFGAMENWGAIFFFESDLLIHPRISTEGDRRNVFIVVAHEMAHQWFGDLVTMAWWDDLWLNEGFASWMENKAADHFHPEWQVWLEGLDEKEAAMQIDARRGTHPIIQPIRDVLQANQAFDTITYLKGEAVIRMLESYLGDAVFRAGVQRYIKAHEYGNTVTDELWQAIDAVAPTPITPMAHDFTLQPGVPLIRVSREGSGLRLTQGSFRVQQESRDSTVWHVPVLTQPLAGGQGWRGVVTRELPASLPAAGAVELVNAGQTGYFRTLYAAAELRPLVVAFRRLHPADELGLMNDAYALGRSGEEPMGDFMALASETAPGMDALVLATLARRLAQLDILYDGLPGQARFRAFGQRVLGPVLAQVGWSARPGESQNEKLLRSAVLSALGELGDRGVIDMARMRFAAYLHDQKALSPDLRRSVLRIVALHADDSSWEALHELAMHASSSLEKEELYDLLGSPLDPGLARRALAVVLTQEVPITYRPHIISSVAVHHPHLAFDFTLAHLRQIMEMIEPDSRTTYVPQLAESAWDAKVLGQLKAYTQAHIPPTAQQRAVQAESTIAYRVEIRTRRLPEIDQWLQAHGSAAEPAASAAGE